MKHRPQKIQQCERCKTWNDINNRDICRSCYGKLHPTLKPTPPFEYVRHYRSSNHTEEATTTLAWFGDVLMQEWRISEVRDIFCDEAKTDYSHTENHREFVWRPIKHITSFTPTTP